LEEGGLEFRKKWNVLSIKKKWSARSERCESGESEFASKMELEVNPESE